MSASLVGSEMCIRDSHIYRASSPRGPPPSPWAAPDYYHHTGSTITTITNTPDKHQPAAPPTPPGPPEPPVSSAHRHRHRDRLIRVSPLHSQLGFSGLRKARDGPFPIPRAPPRAS
eukprot:15442054-Alexandrium_andersonii.AAC.1